MIDTKSEIGDVYLQPGELFLAREPTIIRTILGSCVGATFWSAHLGIGALFHAQLPKCPMGRSANLNLATGTRYVDFSIRHLARQFDELGVHRSELQVKLFGGADVLLGDSESLLKPTVGSMNCDAALETLSTEGFRVMASSVRGTRGRKIQFHTRTGEVLVRCLK